MKGWNYFSLFKDQKHVFPPPKISAPHPLPLAQEKQFQYTNLTKCTLLKATCFCGGHWERKFKLEDTLLPSSCKIRCRLEGAGPLGSTLLLLSQQREMAAVSQRLQVLGNVSGDSAGDASPLSMAACWVQMPSWVQCVMPWSFLLQMSLEHFDYSGTELGTQDTGSFHTLPIRP